MITYSMNFKEFFFSEQMTRDEFARLQGELPDVMRVIFGKKNINAYGPGEIIFSMGTRWGRLKLSAGGKPIDPVLNPIISMEFQWDRSGKSGVIPDKMQADTVWEGSFAWARALKQIAKWSRDNGIGISYGAIPDRNKAYTRLLNSMGFEQSSGQEHKGWVSSSRFFPKADQ